MIFFILAQDRLRKHHEAVAVKTEVLVQTQ